MAMTKTKSAPSSTFGQLKRPRQAAWAGWLTIPHLYRIVALGLVFDAFTGGAPALWAIPAIGDVLTGITVPLVAYGLWRKDGLGVWTIAIVWNALAVVDLLTGGAFIFLVPLPGAPDVGVAFALFAATIISTHILSIILLTRKHVRSYYLSPLLRTTGS